MSEKLPSREQALKILRQNECSLKVIKHCKAVAKLAVETAETCKQKGVDVDVALVEAGALLHDVGRSKTHTVHHAVVGAQIAESAGLPKPIVSIIKRHVGGGMTPSEAEKLGWPVDDIYVPVTLEEKLVSYADKLIKGTRRVPVEITIEELYRNSLPEAAERVRKLNEEITGLVGDGS